MDDALADTGQKNASLDRIHEAGVWRLLSPGRLFVLAFALRCAFALWLPDAIVWPDGERYVLIAENLLAGAGFGSLEMNKIAVPTQPLLIAALLGISGHSYAAARVGFALIGALSCVLTYQLATAVFDRRVGSLAALLLAIYPLHAYSSALFEIPQGIFILLMSAALLALNAFASRRESGMLLAAGIACGGAALSVPTVLPYLAALPAWFILVDARVGFWLRNTGVFLCGVVLVLAPWVARNYAAYDRFVLINAAGGENFWKANSLTYERFGRRAAVLPCESGPAGNGYCEELAAVQSQVASQHLSETDSILLADRLAWQRGIAFAQENPIRFVKLTLRKFCRLFDPRPDPVSAASADPSGVRASVSIMTSLPILVLGLAGIALSYRRWRQLLPLYAYMASLAIAYSVFLPSTRYRLPIDAILVIFAAVALLEGSGRIRNRRQAGL